MIVQTDNGFLTYAQREGQTDVEYEEFVEFIKSKPEQPDGYVCRLRWPEKTWELFEIDESDDLDDSEALEILLGGAS